MATTQANLVLRQLRDWSAAGHTGRLADRQLLEQFTARHEEAAFETWVQRHGPLVRGVCRRVLHNWHDAEDAFQATFLTLARKAASISKQDSVGGWLHQVAYNLALKAKAHAATRQARER